MNFLHLPTSSYLDVHFSLSVVYKSLSKRPNFRCFLVGLARAQRSPFYTQKSRANPTKTIFFLHGNPLSKIAKYTVCCIIHFLWEYSMYSWGILGSNLHMTHLLNGMHPQEGPRYSMDSFSTKTVKIKRYRLPTVAGAKRSPAQAALR